MIEVSTGDVALRARTPTTGAPIASTTKLMTALLDARAAASSPTTLHAPPLPRRCPAESLIGLRPGERMTVRDLLRGLLVDSANDAAMTLAEGVAGSERAFVRLMNRRAPPARAHRDTHYANPIGLDAAGATTRPRATSSSSPASCARNALLPPHRRLAER